jgi:hypothetical protein
MAGERQTVHDKLDRIAEKQDFTNGRVGDLWETVYGDASKKVPGLVETVSKIDKYVSDQRAVGRAVKVVLPILAAGNLGVIGVALRALLA